MPLSFPCAGRARCAPIPRAFTLIELLIVVAIISILAAIAVPNFLEAQTRAKVSRVKNDLRTIATAVESYRIDNNKYPPRQNAITGYAAPRRNERIAQMSKLTSPIAYITTLPTDVFQKIIPPPNDLLEYWSPKQTAWFYNTLFDPPGVPENLATFREENTGWMMFSVGPDGFQGVLATGIVTTSPNLYQNPLLWPETLESLGTGYFPYDPTNGTVSWGNIYSTQKSGVGGASQELTALFLNR